MSKYKEVCNYISRYIFETKDLAQVSVNKALYYKIRQEFSFGSQLTQNCIKTVIAKYRTLKSLKHEWTFIKFNKPQLDLVWNRDYSITGSMFSVCTLNGRLKLDYVETGMSDFFDKTWTFGTAKLVFKKNKWFLHIPFSKNLADVKDSNICNVTGVDLGINFLAVTYNSNGKSEFFSGRHIKNKRANFKNIRKSLQKRKTASSRRKLKKIGQRENRWMQDVNHQVSKALVESQPKNTLFVLEDLTGMRSFTEQVRLAQRYVQVSWAFYDLRMKIEYKALKFGSKSIAIDASNTSLTCPKCGHTARNNRNRKKHIFCCKNCGYTSNDDRIAGMNLYRKGIEYLGNCSNAVA
jgi:IS605 OrfB family transposase